MNKLPPKWTIRTPACALIALCVIIGAGIEQAPGLAQGKKEIPAWEAQKISQLRIGCVAEPAVIKPGETARIVATVSSALNRPLTYGYSASAGRIAGIGATEIYSSEGVPPSTVEITCRVSDDQGRTAIATASVSIGAPGAIHLPDHLIKNPGLTGSAVDYPVPPPPPPPKAAKPTLPTEAFPAPVMKVAPGHQPTPVASKPQLPTQIAQSQSVQSAHAPSNEYAPGFALEAWKKGLKEGHIHYSVPLNMKAQVKSPVTVQIRGFKDAAGAQPLLGETGSGTLKVSSFMKVELLAPLNPDEFTIAPQDKDAVKFVPIDGSATWNWIVIPAYEAENQKLEIRVSLVYQRPDKTLEDPLEDTNYTVNVEVQKLTTTLWQDFQKDPIEFIKYMAPGGAGWAALAALVTSMGGFAWWKKKRAKKTTHRARAQ